MILAAKANENCIYKSDLVVDRLFSLFSAHS